MNCDVGSGVTNTGILYFFAASSISSKGSKLRQRMSAGAPFDISSSRHFALCSAVKPPRYTISVLPQTRIRLLS